MKTTKIIAGLLVSALLSTTWVFAANTSSTGMTMPMTNTAKVAAKKVVTAKKIVAKKASKKVVAKKVAKKTTKKTTKKTSSIKK